MEKKKFNRLIMAALIGSIVVAIILIAGTVWIGSTASEDAEKAVRNVSLLYLDELFRKT